MPSKKPVAVVSGGIAVPVGVEPENGPRRRRQPTKGPDRRVTIPSQDHREPTGSADGAYRDGDATHELKASANLRRRLIRISLNHLNVRNRVSPSLEVRSKSSLEQMLRTGATAPATAGGIVGNEKKLNIHS